MLIVLLVAAVAPVALVANDAKNLMEAGREAASRGLAAARDGDTITASASFHEAALTFEQARDKLESTPIAGSVAVPFLAPNVRAARTLAEIGSDLGNAGESVTVAVDPQELQVIDGRLPLDVVERVTPVLRQGADTLSSARERLDDIRDDPYLAGPVREAVRKVHTQLARADREAQHAAAAAELAPALFGGKGTRRYLLVVQNNAEGARHRRLHRELRHHHRAGREARRRRAAAHDHVERRAARPPRPVVHGAGRLPRAVRAVPPGHDAPEREPLA